MDGAHPVPGGVDSVPSALAGTTLTLDLYRLDKPQELWRLFAPHHYLRADLHSSARCWLGVLDGQPVAFASSIIMPSGTLRDAWREHRTVVLPDYQGLGFGLRLSEWLGELHLAQGHRFYSRTTHPRIGEARDQSPRWRATKWSKQRRRPEWSSAGQHDTKRVAYSHEYVGDRRLVTFRTAKCWN